MKLKWVGWGAVALVLGLVAAGLQFVLPRQDVVRVTGVEVRRMDAQGVISATNPADGAIRDVYFINTEDLDNHQPRVFRNEDTGWGFPWYLKFDSGDVHAKAQSIARDNQNLALIRYYGWRSHVFSMFPNVTDIKATTTRDEPLPWFNMLFFVVLFSALGWCSWKVRQFLRHRTA